MPRFIPTCVGFILAIIPCRNNVPVHPHVRGVYLCSASRQGGNHGSSPRAWGLCVIKCSSKRSGRFIPTCVGFMHPAPPSPFPPAVHPHVRGVYVLSRTQGMYGDGSSPRAWGLYHLLMARQRQARFIPTCVGFMLEKKKPMRPLYGSSPRAWGLCACARFVGNNFGSSPRAWGLCSTGFRHCGNRRFIPTCVGFMPKTTLAPSSLTVHPHVRGVYDADKEVYLWFGGSSPRAWGLCRKISRCL